jgi:hypothetical protein
MPLIAQPVTQTQSLKKKINSTSFLPNQNKLSPHGDMFPLTVGNKYQYIQSSAYSKGGYWYDVFNMIITNDTVINNLHYFYFDNSADLFRYDKDSNKAYFRYNDTEGVYCDFNLSSGNSFTQFNNYSHTFWDAKILQVSSNYIYGKYRTVFECYGYNNSDSYTEDFVEDIGRDVLASHHQSGIGFWDSYAELVDAVVYDSIGNFIYYTDG